MLDSELPPSLAGEDQMVDSLQMKDGQDSGPHVWLQDVDQNKGHCHVEMLQLRNSVGTDQTQPLIDLNLELKEESTGRAMNMTITVHTPRSGKEGTRRTAEAVTGGSVGDPSRPRLELLCPLMRKSDECNWCTGCCRW